MRNPMKWDRDAEALLVAYLDQVGGQEQEIREAVETVARTRDAFQVEGVHFLEFSVSRPRRSQDGRDTKAGPRPRGGEASTGL